MRGPTDLQIYQIRFIIGIPDTRQNLPIRNSDMCIQAGLMEFQNIYLGKNSSSPTPWSKVSFWPNPLFAHKSENLVSSWTESELLGYLSFPPNPPSQSDNILLEGTLPIKDILIRVCHNSLFLSICPPKLGLYVYIYQDGLGIFSEYLKVTPGSAVHLINSKEFGQKYKGKFDISVFCIFFIIFFWF